MASSDSHGAEPAAYTADMVRRVLFTMCGTAPTSAAPARLVAMNRAALRLLRFGMERGRPDLVSGAAQAIARTATADPLATATCLRELVDGPRITVRMLDAFARDVRDLVPIAPDVVARLVDAAFAVAPGTGVVVRGQFSMSEAAILDFAQRAYVDTLPVLLSHAPELAVPLIHRVLSNFAREQDHDYVDDSEPARFEFRGRESGAQEDWGLLWRDREQSHGLRAGLALVSAVCSAGGEELDQLLETIAGRTWPGFFWALLAERAAGASPAVAHSVSELVTPPLLELRSTSVACGELLRALAGSSPDLVRDIEAWLLRARAQFRNEHDEESHRLNRILGCIPPEVLATDDAREWRARLDADGGPPPNDEGFHVSVGYRAPERWEWFRRQGIDVDDPTIAVGLEAIDAAAMFAERGDKEELTKEEAIQAEGTLEALRDLLEASTLPPPILMRGHARLIDAASHAASVAVNVPSIARLARQVIAIGAAIDDPEPPSTGGEGWSDADPQIESATGIIRVVCAAGTSSEGDRAQIRRLVAARDPRVRAHVAGWLNGLVFADEPFMWELAADIVAREEDDAVVGRAASALSHVARRNPERAGELARALLARADLRHARNSREGRAVWAQLAAQLDVYHGSVSARAALTGILADVTANNSEVGGILHVLRRDGAFTTDKDSARLRAHQVALTVARALGSRTNAGNSGGRDLEDDLANQLLFAVQGAQGSERHDATRLARFFSDAAETIATVAGFRLNKQSPRYFTQLLVFYARHEANAAVASMEAFLDPHAELVSDVTMSPDFELFFGAVAGADMLTPAARATAVALVGRFTGAGLPMSSRFVDLAGRIARR